VDISKVIAEMDISINAMNSRTNKQEIATCSLEFEISSVDKLNHLIKKLRQIEGVIEVERSKG
jgi:GTP pyrophosphokinase